MFGTKFTVKEVTLITSIAAIVVAIPEVVKYAFRSKSEKTTENKDGKTDIKQAVNH